MQAIQKETTRGWVERISKGYDSAKLSEDKSAHYQELARQFDTDTKRRGLEALVDQDKDILKTVQYLDIASQNETRELRGLTYVILDVDQMSVINMKYGRNVGDLILRHIRKVANEVLLEKECKAYYIGKPSEETPQSKGDQLIVYLNHAYMPQDDLNKLIYDIKEKVATRVYDDLILKFPSMPASWKGLEQEKISVSIGYVAVFDALIYTKDKRGEDKCTTATSLRDVATHNLKVAKEKNKKTGNGTAYGLN